MFSGQTELLRAAQVGQNWNQLVAELYGWHVFARDLDYALNTKQI